MKRWRPFLVPGPLEVMTAGAPVARNYYENKGKRENTTVGRYETIRTIDHVSSHSKYLHLTPVPTRKHKGTKKGSAFHNRNEEAPWNRDLSFQGIHEPTLLKRHETSVPHDDMIQNANPKSLRGHYQPASENEILL